MAFASDKWSWSDSFPAFLETDPCDLTVIVKFITVDTGYCIFLLPRLVNKWSVNLVNKCITFVVRQSGGLSFKILVLLKHSSVFLCYLLLFILIDFLFYANNISCDGNLMQEL